MKIILISGKAGSGKDTAAGIIKDNMIADGIPEKRILITHFADLLKYIASKFFGWDGVKDENGRTLLQYLGTDVVRKKDKNFWTSFILKILNLFGDSWDYVLIPDTRFLNEIQDIKAVYNNILTVRIERPTGASMTSSQASHPSETELDAYPFDLILENTFDSLDELKEYIRSRRNEIYAKNSS
jgi:hypothetical protein